MSELPFISICIPAYKRIEFLKRLFDSIAIQTYTHYEVVVTDDSPDDSVKEFVSGYTAIANIRFYRNGIALGTPENWNESIRKASGEWIKLMHDDDWFSGPGSLARYVTGIRPDNDFIFSAYENVYEEAKSPEIVTLSLSDKKIFASDAMTLMGKNVIGPPSATFYRKTPLQYDTRMKWLVDIDFYIHYLKDPTFEYIDEPLIKVGISQEQVTQSCFRVPEVEIPEHFLLLEKTGIKRLRHLMVYDAWWRLLRNLNIRSDEQIRQAGFREEIHPLIRAMISDQLHLPRRLLRAGLFSKIFMSISYALRIHLIK